MSTTVSTTTPADSFAAAVATHAARNSERLIAEAAHLAARDASQAVIDRVASGQPGSTGELRRSEEAVAEAYRGVTLAGAVAASAKRQKDEAEVRALHAEAEALRASHVEAVGLRTAARVSLFAKLEAAQAALLRYNETARDVQIEYQRGSHFDGAMAARVAGNAVLAALDNGDHPRVGLQAPVAPQRLQVELVRDLGTGELSRVNHIAE